MRYFYLLLFLSLLGLSKLSAQIDTSFWFVAPDISADLGDNPIKLNFTTYNAPSTVIIRQPANGTFTPISFTMAANSYSSTVLTASISGIENNSANTTLTRGFWISSSANVSAIYSIESASNKEMLSLKGRKAIGTDFYTPFQNFWTSAQKTATNAAAYNASSFDIVATQNNTQLVITPRANIIGHAKDVTFTKILQMGETFSCQDTTTLAPTKLAGSIISSDKPVAITVTSSGLKNAGCRSNVSDQITNSSYAGNDFVITRGNTGVDKVYILATVNSTSITAYHTGTVSTLINTGETYTVDASLSDLTYIKSTKPVYVLHVSGFGCKLSGEQIPNFYCAGTYTTAFMRTAADSFGLNLYTRNGFQSMFLLNGSAALVPAAGFSVVPGTGGTIVGARFYYNTIQVPVGSYNTVTNSGDIFGCGVTEGKSNSGGSYVHVNDFVSYPAVDAGPLTATICSNTSLSLNGYSGGGNVTGQWTTSGFGAFSSGTTALTNTYIPSALDTAIKPVNIVLRTTGPCPSRTDTIKLTVRQAPLVNASVDQVKCGNNGTVTLSGSIQGATSTGQWLTLGCGTFAPTNTVLTGSYIPCSGDTAAGFVKLVLISTNNGLCLAVTDTVKITYTKPALVDAGPTSLTLCSNNPNVPLNGSISTGTNNGKWTTSGSGVFNPDNITMSASYIPSSADIAASTVTIRLQSRNNGLCFAVFDSILVNFTIPPNVSAGPDLFSCKNAPDVNLSGVINGATTTGNWSGGTGTYNPNSSALNATYTPSGAEATAGFVILTLTSTNNGNCFAVSDQMRIDFKDKPLANFAVTTVCQKIGTQFQDASSPIASGSFISGWDWSFGDGGTAIIKNPNYTYSTSGTFNAKLIVKNSFGCYDTIQKPVTVYALPNALFGYSRTCFGSALKINFSDSSTIASPDTVKTFFWDYGGLGTSSLKNPSQVFPFSGTYNVTHIAISNKGCRDTLVKPILITPRPKAGFYFSNNSGANLGTTVMFTDTSKSASVWAWTFGDGNTSGVKDPTNIYLANGTYTVTEIITDQFGCRDTARATLKILNVVTELNNLIPNAISPNGDGKNDIWRLDFIQIFYPDAIVEVFNRWGEQIFYSHDGYKIAWDGTYKGAPLPVGSYYYVINLNSAKDEQSIYKGPILLVK